MARDPDLFDVVVVGAGMTGATLALALVHAGLRVAVVDALAPERRADPAFDARGLAVSYANMRLWRALGVADAILSDAQPITRIVVADGPGPGAAAPGWAPAVLGFDAGALAANEGEPLAWMVEAPLAQAALNAAMRASPVELFAPMEIASLAIEGACASLSLANGRSLKAAVAVGADGRNSVVRQAAAIGVNGWTYGQSGVAATVQLARPHEGTAMQAFLPGGPLAVLPLTGGRASLVWTERTPQAQGLAAASPEIFEAHLARRFGDQLGRPRLVGARASFPLRLQIATARTAPRAALVGDAAHVIHPIAGQGLNLGLKDVAALAEVLADAHRLGEDLGSEPVLDRYARWRRFDTASLALATDLFNRLFAMDHPLAKAARNAGLAMVDRSPPLKRLFVRQAGADLGDLPRLLRGEAL